MSSKMICLKKMCKLSLKDGIKNKRILLDWCNVAKVSNIVSHNTLRWLGHLTRMPDAMLPNRVLFVYTDGSDLRAKS